MIETFELKGPAGRIVVRRHEVLAKLGRGYEFCNKADEARFEKLSPALDPATIDPSKAKLTPIDDIVFDDEDED